MTWSGSATTPCTRARYSATHSGARGPHGGRRRSAAYLVARVVRGQVPPSSGPAERRGSRPAPASGRTGTARADSAAAGRAARRIRAARRRGCPIRAWPIGSPRRLAESSCRLPPRDTASSSARSRLDGNSDPGASCLERIATRSACSSRRRSGTPAVNSIPRSTHRSYLGPGPKHDEEAVRYRTSQVGSYLTGQLDRITGPLAN